MTVEQALAHPTWAMGGKITIDSATLMNKGLEVMEAHHLFGMPYERIDVRRPPAVARPRAGQLCDGAMLAHLGRPDMRSRSPTRSTAARASSSRSSRSTSRPVGELTFEPADLDAFPCLRLAREAARAGGTAPCVLNAANEVAVARVPRRAPPLPRDRRGDRADPRRSWRSEPVRAFESLFEADRQAREVAGDAVSRRYALSRPQTRAARARRTACPATLSL